MKSMKKVFLVLLVLTVCITAASADGWVIRTSDIVSMMENLECSGITVQEDGIVNATSGDGYLFRYFESDVFYIFRSWWTADLRARDANSWNMEVSPPTMYIDDDGTVVVEMLIVKEGITRENLSATLAFFIDSLPDVEDFLYD